ncbi:hypothetical protein FRACA_200053 [Frankia canadensis]|uniref:Uncharacterized protein n=1 Tax=Frankia canadensis TaxID=1836972 RepID=A0A2I2KQ69_9ACTN|nr:hypothetical protein [Frankia canadensis]SNQ47815.1 hypothetical protein FRACA_200053 [Frankia canadensis]SOU55105.1 hypothetical protein FRACA_200053 [Frankia canadensis]
MVIDDCFGGSRQQFQRRGTPTGETGTRSAQTVTLVPRGSGWVAQDLGPGPAATCD